MKITSLFLSIVCSIICSAQVLNKKTSSHYKPSHPIGFKLSETSTHTSLSYKITPSPLATSTPCNCKVATDTSFKIVPFIYQSGLIDTTLANYPNYRNDDHASAVIHLPFSFCYYGTQVDSCFINNNGNISFKSQIYSFTAGGFPAKADTIMIAPFWADVDTRGPKSGVVRYKITPTALIVKWDTVGVFEMNDSLRNTFQLIITNGSDPILPAGNNVSFCYGDMQWTTGTASLGINGFGGTPATVGANKGDGVNYYSVW